VDGEVEPGTERRLPRTLLVLQILTRVFLLLFAIPPLFCVGLVVVDTIKSNVAVGPGEDSWDRRCN
jgi:hypothetical protein